MNFKKIFKEFISFNSRRAKIINFSALLVTLRIIPPEKIGSICIFKNFIFPLVFESCPTKGLFVGCNCPACGLTRGTSYFLHGQIKEAIYLNKLVLLVVPFILFLILINAYYLIKKRKKK